MGPTARTSWSAARKGAASPADGSYSIGFEALNELVLQSGLTIGINKLLIFIAVVTVASFAAAWIARGSALEALLIALFCGIALPYLVLHPARRRPGVRRAVSRWARHDRAQPARQARRCRSPSPWWRAKCGPIGSEFGIVADEIAYGADLETALRNLYFRIGQDDLPLFVTAVAIQGSTGGNLGEILENLSGVIRQRFKMRLDRLAAEGRASALILSSLPIAIFLMIQIVAPDFYAGVWNEDITKTALMVAGTWMGIGNFIMYRLVNFRI